MPPPTATPGSALMLPNVVLCMKTEEHNISRDFNHFLDSAVIELDVLNESVAYSTSEFSVKPDHERLDLGSSRQTPNMGYRRRKVG